MSPTDIIDSYHTGNIIAYCENHVRIYSKNSCDEAKLRKFYFFCTCECVNYECWIIVAFVLNNPMSLR